LPSGFSTGFCTARHGLVVPIQSCILSTHDNCCIDALCLRQVADFARNFGVGL
jgi:hypothetical protein